MVPASVVCYQDGRSDLKFQRVYEFLSQLRKEFEPRYTQLLARGRVSLMEALSEIGAEETCLCGACLLEVPSVLIARYSATRLLHPLWCSAAPTHSSWW